MTADTEGWGEVVAELDLCTGPAAVGGFTFTCADKADSQTTWACTGGHHTAPGEWVRCTCACHVFDPQATAREALGSGPLTGGTVWPPRGPEAPMLDPRPARTVLAADAAHPCACVGLHRPVPAEYERHHVHPEFAQRAAGLPLARLTGANEYHHGTDLTDEHGAYWVALCGNAHGIVHYLLRLYARDGRLPLGAQRLNPYCRLLAFEGHRRVLEHGGWGPAPAPPAAFTA